MASQVEYEWIEINDPQSSRSFFANIKSGECSWERPENANIKERNPDVDEWWELFDNNHGLPYYYNLKTRKTEWKRPENATIIPLIAIQNTTIAVSMQMRIQKGGGSQAQVMNEPMEPSPTFDQQQQRPNGIPDNSLYNGNVRIDKNSSESIYAAKVGRTQGISSPVINNEAAVRMNPVHPLNRQHTPSLPHDLKNNIKQFKIEGFAHQYFMEHRAGIFRRKVPVEKLLVWTKDSIKAPLMALNKELQKEAPKCFKLIQRIMGDRSPLGTSDDIQLLLEKGIMHGQLRDEIFVQLCKQLSQNPSPDSLLLGWQLMSVIVITFPPSKNFEDYLTQFIKQYYDQEICNSPFTSQGQKHTIYTIITHCIKKLDRICKTGPKGKVPTINEIEAGKEAPFKPSLFGETLNDIMKIQESIYPQLKIPRILDFLAKAVLDLNGCHTEGIFRVPGDVDMVSELRCRIDQEQYNMGNIKDPNVPASLLKFWLRDLADPLIPTENYQDCINVGSNEGQENSTENAWGIVKVLPEPNRRVVNYMINFLRIIADQKNQPITKMTLANLAMVFAPNFLRCPSDNLTTIFDNTKFEQAFLRILILNGSDLNDPNGPLPEEQS